MRTRNYLLVAGMAFLLATTGSDLIARTFIGGESLSHAATEHFYYAALQIIGTAMLLAPFMVVALICAKLERRVHMGASISVFTLSILVLLWFYFEGYQASQHALLEERWTAAALSIGLLPFFIGLPVVLVAAIAGWAMAALQPRPSTDDDA